MSSLLYLTSFAVALTISLILVPYIKCLAIRVGAIDQPGPRRIHKQPIPRMGGLAIVLSFLAVLSILAVSFPQDLQVWEGAINVTIRNFVAMITAIIVLVVAGLYDDTKDLTASWKLLWQLVAAYIILGFGIQIPWVTNPFGEGQIVLGSWNYLIVPAWLILTTNSMNWFDGVDGLAGGLSAIAFITLGLLSLDPVVNQPVTAILAFTLAGAILGFLPANWFPAKIFLGDTGSMFLGFMIGVLAIISGAKLATAALVLGVPIFDAIWVIGHRLIKRKPIWQADQNHLHHRLIDAGLSIPKTVITIYTMAAIFGIIALLSGTRGKVLALGWLIVVMILLAGYLMLRQGTGYEKRKS